VLQSVSYVVLRVLALEGRVVDLHWPHLINVTRNYVIPPGLRRQPTLARAPVLGFLWRSCGHQ